MRRSMSSEANSSHLGERASRRERKRGREERRGSWEKRKGCMNFQNKTEEKKTPPHAGGSCCRQPARTCGQRGHQTCNGDHALLRVVVPGDMNQDNYSLFTSFRGHKQANTCAKVRVPPQSTALFLPAVSPESGTKSKITSP